MTTIFIRFIEWVSHFRLIFNALAALLAKIFESSSKIIPVVAKLATFYLSWLLESEVVLFIVTNVILYYKRPSFLKNFSPKMFGVLKSKFGS